MKTKQILLIIPILLGIVFLFNINISVTPKLDGDINFKKLEISNSINDTHNPGILGNYLFLMSPVPNDENNDDWYNNPSFLFVTNNDFNILNVIQLDGYFEEISLEDGTLYIYTKDTEDNDYIKDMKTPLQMASSYNNGEYSEFKENSDDISSISSPTVGLSPNTITIIDQEQAISLKDPTFNFNDHDYFVVDFVQNINSVQTEAVENK